MSSCPSASIRHQQASLGNQPQGLPWAFVTDKRGHPSSLKDGASPTPTSRALCHWQSSDAQREPFTHPFSLLVYAFVLKTCREELASELTKGGGGR